MLGFDFAKLRGVGKPDHHLGCVSCFGVDFWANAAGPHRESFVNAGDDDGATNAERITAVPDWRLDGLGRTVDLGRHMTQAREHILLRHLPQVPVHFFAL